jgi:CubicO group peptidase (beta-lactamase class C family)
MATKSTVKLSGLTTPIVLDSKAIAAHGTGPAAPDTVDLQKKFQSRQTREIQKIAARSMPVLRPAARSAAKKTVKKKAAKKTVAKKLDRTAFLDDLAGQLSTQTEGFAIEISYPYHSGRRHETRVNGYAIDPVDPGSRPWTKHVVQHVASISKLVTAMAMTRRHHDLEISPNKAIGAYLPPFWTQGPNIGAVTFAQLMTHKSGIRTAATDWASMEALVNTGVSAANVGVYQYENTNFSLCRILLATLLMITLKRVHGVKTYTFVNVWPATDAARDLLSIQSYQTYVKKRVLISGETVRFMSVPGDALAYAFPKPPNNGWASGDHSTTVGAAGWHFSTTDILRFMGDFRRSGRIVKRRLAQKMLDDSFGIDMITNPGGGTIYGKNGYWYDGIRVEQATVFFLPHQTEFVILVNSSLLKNPPNDTWLMGFVESIYAAHLS